MYCSVCVYVMHLGFTIIYMADLNFDINVGHWTLGLIFAIYLTAMVFLLRLSRSYFRSRQELRAQLEAFCVDNTHCFLQSDRSLISESIGNMFAKGDESLGITRFNKAVRGEFKNHILEVIGHEQHVQYNYTFFICIPLLWNHLDYVGGYIGSLTLSDTLRHSTLFAIYVFCIGPLFCKFIFWLSRWSSPRLVALVDIVASAFLAVFLVGNYALMLLATINWYATMAYAFFAMVLTWWCFRQPRLHHYRTSRSSVEPQFDGVAA